MASDDSHDAGKASRKIAAVKILYDDRNRDKIKYIDLDDVVGWDPEKPHDPYPIRMPRDKHGVRKTEPAIVLGVDDSKEKLVAHTGPGLRLGSNHPNKNLLRSPALAQISHRMNKKNESNDPVANEDDDDSSQTEVMKFQGLKLNKTKDDREQERRVFQGVNLTRMELKRNLNVIPGGMDETDWHEKYISLEKKNQEMERAMTARDEAFERQTKMLEALQKQVESMSGMMNVPTTTTCESRPSEASNNGESSTPSTGRNKKSPKRTKASKKSEPCHNGSKNTPKASRVNQKPTPSRKGSTQKTSPHESIDVTEQYKHDAETSVQIEETLQIPSHENSPERDEVPCTEASTPRSKVSSVPSVTSNKRKRMAPYKLLDGTDCQEKDEEKPRVVSKDLKIEKFDEEHPRRQRLSHWSEERNVGGKKKKRKYLHMDEGVSIRKRSWGKVKEEKTTSKRIKALSRICWLDSEICNRNIKLSKCKVDELTKFRSPRRPISPDKLKAIEAAHELLLTEKKKLIGLTELKRRKKIQSCRRYITQRANYCRNAEIVRMESEEEVENQNQQSQSPNQRRQKLGTKSAASGSTMKDPESKKKSHGNRSNNGDVPQTDASGDCLGVELSKFQSTADG
ncbi:hypothetical protein QAD02_001267 [Eretmocerus hayati]|uniref:Uncharacterized protein n=1 Tax=Eretmocerus hayati TaxID=131215 RepID=A0ACC2NGS7_9HYME|nr:hypothetical protein QAD02_001267 [Eretmocerus hayati]